MTSWMSDDDNMLSVSPHDIMLSMKSDPLDELALLVADVYELSGVLRRHGETFAGGVGQTQARWQVLSVVSEGEWTVPQVARRLGVSRQAVQRVADDLDADDLVRYAPNPQHRRSALLELTPEGRRALAVITAAAGSWHAEVATGLDGAAVRRARRVLRQILDRIDEIDAHDEI